jgi:hypothetical protein
VEKNDLLTSLSEEYARAHSDADIAAVNAFCVFARDWLQQRGVIGVGHTTEGISLRFADNTEFQLVSVESGTDVGGAFSITGQAGKSDRVSVNSNSVSITGR